MEAGGLPVSRAWLQGRHCGRGLTQGGQGRAWAVGGSRLAWPRGANADSGSVVPRSSATRSMMKCVEEEEWSGQTHQPLHSAHRCHGQHGRCRSSSVAAVFIAQLNHRSFDFVKIITIL